MKRSTAFFINGGAGRVLCSIPAFEAYEKEHPEDDFIIVCEGGMDFYKGHPSLHKRSYDAHHKDLFQLIKSRNCVTPEPYRVWEYYNQQANLVKAFDIAINGISDSRKLTKPTLVLNSNEYFSAIDLIKEVKDKTKKTKVVVFQPFGRGSAVVGSIRRDETGRSLSLSDTVKIIQELQKTHAVIFMHEQGIDFTKEGCKDPVACPQGINLRAWAGIIKEADHFLGIDSVGQHIAHSVGTPATVIIGATFPENVSYPDNKEFTVLDFGGERRMYDPIRLTFDEVSTRNNEMLLQLNKAAIDVIVSTVNKSLKGEKK